jgi:hypothetical protein
VGFRVSLAGALTGGALGGLGRILVTMAHLQVTADTGAILFVPAAIGIVVGGLAGMSGRALTGAVIGAALSALVYVGAYPIVLLFHALGALLPASWQEVVAVGALAGGLGGATGQVLARRRSRR